MPSATGALSPVEAAQATLDTGVQHLSEPILLAFVKNVYGALLLSAGSLLAQILSTGIPGVSEENPGFQRLLQGLAFPLGLIFVYLVGAELYTGYPMWYSMTMLARQGSPLQYLRSIVVVWLGNLIGALFFAFCFSYATGTLEQQPWHKGVIDHINEEIVETPWHQIFIRSIACGWLVTVAMFLGTQNQDGISKALGLHLPFFVATAAQFPHTVKYMYLASTAMMLGAPLSIGGYIWKCLLPITLGNTIGGGVLTGAYLYYVNIRCENTRKAKLHRPFQSLNDESYQD
ncbi:hypothetical protein LTS08_001945 [Lithohypha guttulata]|nr:hypothetical protein LTS08_001945 [Lithohypha guttulata]